MRLRQLGLIAAIVFTASGTAYADAPVPASVGLDYKIYIGGIEALTATATIGADAAQYDIEIHAATGGSIGKLFPWSVEIGSKGNVSGDTLQPVQHRQTSNFQGKDRSVFLDYDGKGGFLERRVVPDNHEDQREEVPADMTRNTLDIVSGILAGLRNVGRTGSCKAQVPVFDGRRRFDLAFSDDGHETLKPGAIGIFGGEAIKCAIKVEPIAGFWRKNQKAFFSHKVDGEEQVVPIKAFVAAVGAARIEAPVRIESSSPFGALVLHLTGIHDNPAPH